MFPALHKKFIIFTPSLASAFPQATSTQLSTTTTQTSTALSLPTVLQVLVPQCAQSCFQSILFDQWPLGCASSGDLECLCSQYSTTGLTLGEAAYGCAFTSCSSSVSGLAATYGICSDQDGAVAPTHSTLTFTAHTTSTTASAASSTLISSSTHGTNTTSTRSSSTSSTSSSRTSSRSTLETSTTAASTTSGAASTTSEAASTTSEAASSTTSQSSASSSAAAAAAASSSDHGSGLSTAQIVGISVASVAAVVLAAGVLFVLACLRKRDRKKEEEVAEKQGMSAFALTPPSHDSVAMSPSAMAQFPSPPRDRRDPRGGTGVGTGGMTNPQVRVVDPSPPRHQRTPTPLESIGLAITEDSPAASFSSDRTRLLPDKPQPVHPRKPLPVQKSPVPTSMPFIEKKKKKQRDSSMSQGTLFEEDTAVRKSMYPVRAVQVPPRQDAPAKVPPVRPYRPPPSFADAYTESPVESARQPSLSLAIPPQGRQITRQPTPSPPPIPSPLRIGVARPPNVAKPPLPLYHPPAALPAALPPAPHSGSASSGSTKFTGTNSTASSSYIPAYYTSPPTSIMQTPPESYTGFTGPQQPPQAGAAPPVFLGQPSSASRPSPQRQAQTNATAPQPMHMHQTPAAVSAVAQNRGVPPQPSFAHLPGGTTGQQAPAPLQGSQANPPALRQQPPPQPAVGQAVPAAVRHDHQQQQDQRRQAPPPVPSAANHRNGPLPPPSWASSTPSSSTGQPTANQGSQYHAYRPPLPPQPRSPPRPPRQTARPPLVKGPQRSTSSASMTSFESASPGDPSPPAEEESDTSAKQLGGDSGSHSHHPHATVTAPASSSTLRLNTTPPQQHSDRSSVEDKSPISDIKYPKVPRASNQAVPRSSPNAGPRTATPSPRVKQHEGDGDVGGSTGSPKGGLQARRGRDGNGLLIIDSGASTPSPPRANNGRKTTPTKKAAGGRSPHTPQGQIIRGDGAQQLDHDPDQARKSSAALPPEQQLPSWPGHEGGGQGDVAIKTPMWAPKLTPTRHGDNMYLAVAYAKKEGISE
ncbi:uncharacterized protein LTHEOB_9774 [Lasiodiplodia theobromae]|uniref:uncharacterized protein n=1 Tax=Lasiodiplodia theobromae TaxID=45133 RepID=UPI0015C31C96|nr:uncharacterized protein LTHEOB_9774 [Lasiodiplodia theobromae]KAF4539962.1 hypothetical protein LTHEOB_9774 [Lasiodiplodia theobromae]